MVNSRLIEQTILAGLAGYLQKKRPRNTELVRANQTGPIPPYPYVAYTVTTLLAQKGGSYCQAQNGELFKSAAQTWSLTVVANDQEEAQEVAMLCQEYLAVTGDAELGDAGIVVAKVGGLGCRDNLMAIEYERRLGFDFTLTLVNRVSATREEMNGRIDRVEWPFAQNRKEEEKNGTGCKSGD